MRKDQYRCFCCEQIKDESDQLFRKLRKCGRAEVAICTECDQEINSSEDICCVADLAKKEMQDK